MTATDPPGSPPADLRSRLVELTKDLVLFPSSLSRPDHRDLCLQFVRNHVEGLPGVRVRDYPDAEYPCFTALPEGMERPEVLICGHIDVVDHAEEAAYRPRVENGRIVGAGSGDMKGPLAAALEVFREVHTHRPGASLGLAVSSDEEIGGEHGIRWLVEERGLRCRRALIPDGGAPDELPAEEKGILHVTLSAACRGRALHASRPWLAENALEQVVDAAARVRARFAELGDGSPDHWHPTCAQTVCRTPNTTANRIPTRAETVLDIRFPPPWTAERIAGEVRAAAGERVELRLGLRAEPTRLDPDPRYREIAAEVVGRPVRLVREAGGSDARFFRPHGIPVILARPRVGDLHSTEEWVDVESLCVFWRIAHRWVTERIG